MNPSTSTRVFALLHSNLAGGSLHLIHFPRGRSNLAFAAECRHRSWNRFAQKRRL
jgi:hypothetical protein